MLERIKALPHKMLGRIGTFLLIVTVGIRAMAAESIILTMVQGTCLLLGIFFIKQAMDKKAAEKALHREEGNTNKGIAKKANAKFYKKDRM